MQVMGWTGQKIFSVYCYSPAPDLPLLPLLPFPLLNTPYQRLVGSPFKAFGRRRVWADKGRSSSQPRAANTVLLPSCEMQH